jgi:hypothetical protein
LFFSACHTTEDQAHQAAQESQQEGHDNVLNLCLIYNQSFQDILLVKVSDEKGVELGRKRGFISGKAGEAGFVEIVFDKRTRIEGNSRVILE